MTQARLDRRVLGALQFVDATTGAAIARTLQVDSDARVYRQRSGLLVVADAPGLHDHTLEFEAPPAAPALGSTTITLRVSDPGRQYQSTTVTLPLPRDPAPGAADGLLQPQPVRLWRTGAAPVSPSWTVYQATLVLSGTDVPVVGALVCLNTDGHSVRGLSDATGQVTLALVGQPLFTLGADATLSRSLAVQVTVRLDLPSAALADTEAEINRLAARPAVVSLARQLLTGAATHEVLVVSP